MAIVEKSDARARLQALKNLLLEEDASTQEGLRFALEKLDFDVNQSTISRDLRRLGAIKVIDAEGKTTYQLSKENSAPFSVSSRTNGISDLIFSIKDNGSLIVISTSPGSASLIARHIDTLRSDEILGTIAGDDTVFIAPANTKQISELVQRLKESWGD